MSPERIGYIHPARGFVRVKSGFSWPAFFLGGLWAVAKGLWLAALGMFAVDVVIWFCSGYAQARGNAALALAGLALQVVYWVVRGRWANGWWRARLLRQGYRATGAKA